MTVAVRHKDPPKYECINNQIGYIDQDGISFNISYGYLTNYAYFEEHSKGQITDDKLKEIMGINISCGYYSYAEAPKEYLKRLGVTGTLETLHSKNLDIMKEYID